MSLARVFGNFRPRLNIAPLLLTPGFAAIGYAIFGAIAGGVSLWAVPDLFIKAGWLRLANLVLTPTIAGLLMAMVGSWRRKREKTVIQLETFSYGFCFALKSQPLP